MSRRAIFERTTQIHASLADVFDFFSTPENLGRITPPHMRFRILAGPNRRLREDDRISYQFRIFGIPMRWQTHIDLWRDGEAFADLQERGPYKYWRHLHSFEETNGIVEMHDRVEYELPFGALGAIFGGWLVRRQLRAIFEYRANVITAVFR